MISDPAQHAAFKKLPLVEFRCSIKEEHPRKLGKTTKTPLPFPTSYLSKISFLYSNRDNTQQQINAKSDARTKQHSHKPDGQELPCGCPRSHASGLPHVFLTDSDSLCPRRSPTMVSMATPPPEESEPLVVRLGSCAFLLPVTTALRGT